MTSRRSKALVPYSADEMFALVADIESYPKFLPWCVALRIVGKRHAPPRDFLTADMVVAYKVFRERFRSEVTLDPLRHAIDVEYIDGPFRTLKNAWRFTDQQAGGCEIDFYIEFEFRNFFLHATAQSVFEKAFARMSDAFVERARVVYGERAFTR